MNSWVEGDIHCVWEFQCASTDSEAYIDLLSINGTHTHTHTQTAQSISDRTWHSLSCPLHRSKGGCRDKETLCLASHQLNKRLNMRLWQVCMTVCVWERERGRGSHCKCLSFQRSGVACKIEMMCGQLTCQSEWMNKSKAYKQTYHHAAAMTRCFR